VLPGLTPLAQSCPSHPGNERPPAASRTTAKHREIRQRVIRVA